MAYVRQTQYLANSAAFLGVNAKTEADQIEALRALVENAHVAILTDQVTSQAIDVRQLASLVAYYGHLLMTTPQARLRAWTTWLKRRQSYIAVDAVATNLPLHSQCAATTWAENNISDYCDGGTNAANAAQPSCATTAAIAHPPLMCEICHEGFVGMECLIHHCQAKHGSWAEYRKHVFWKAQQAGLQPLQGWAKRQMVQNFAFFQNFSVPSSPTNEFTQRTLTEAMPRVQKACVICARMDYVEHRFEVYLFAEPIGLTSIARIAFGRSACSLESNDGEAELVEDAVDFSGGHSLRREAE
jgi:hypothetical protein